MNGEIGIDSDTYFQRAKIKVTNTNEPTHLLQNIENSKYLFKEYPTSIPGYSNCHLHLIHPKYDLFLRHFKKPSDGDWCVEYLSIKTMRNSQCFGPGYVLTIYDSNVMSSDCDLILASTAKLVTKLPDVILKYPQLIDTFQKNNDERIYKICPSLIEEYVKHDGNLHYVMVQPWYSKLHINMENTKQLYNVTYKTDYNNYIAVFSAIAYNKANLNNQLY